VRRVLGSARLTEANMRRLKIQHATEYRFGTSVQLQPHRLILRPRESHVLRIVSSLLSVTPSAEVRWQRDALDNSIGVASFRDPAAVLRIDSEVTVEHYDEAPMDFLVEEYAAVYPFRYDSRDALSLIPFLSMTWPSDRTDVARWLDGLSVGARGVSSFGLLADLNRSISQTFQYEQREEEGVQSPSVTLARRSGSCRDFAALFLDACRYLGFATRFVTGYHTSYAGEVGNGSTHAWAEVYLPGPGWKGFDPSGGVVTGGEHVAVAVAHHPEAVPPVSGSYLGPAEPAPSMQVSVRMVPL
jgi:transglutaminase-like putative cysteine protease